MSMYPVKVMFFMATSRIGGSEKFVIRMLPHFNRKKIDPIVVTLPPADLFNYYVRESGDKSFALDYRGLADLPVALFSLAKLIHVEHIQGIYAFGIIPGILAYTCARLGWVSFVISAQRGDIREKGFRLWLKRYLANRATKTVYNSRIVHDTATTKFGFDPGNARIIRGGVEFSDPCVVTNSKMSWRDLCSIFGIKDSQSELVRYVIGTVASLRKEKDYFSFIKAAQQVLQQRTDVRFISVGEGKLRGELEELVRQLGIQQYVFFLGFQRNTLDIMKAMDIFVLSSITEGLPTAILEAMSLGKPVVATAVGGVPELVREGENGFLVPAGDYMALASSILTFLDSASLRKRLGQRGREIAMHEFSIEHAARETENLIICLSANYRRTTKW